LFLFLLFFQLRKRNFARLRAPTGQARNSNDRANTTAGRRKKNFVQWSAQACVTSVYGSSPAFYSYQLKDGGARAQLGISDVLRTSGLARYSGFAGGWKRGGRRACEAQLKTTKWT
jgi:hypothetical protein